MFDEFDTIDIGYTYIDENIDAELVCAICADPYQHPVYLPCRHTFCCECLERWYDENRSCPTCRQSSSDSRTATEYRSVTTPIVRNQLNRLLVRCKTCEETNIQRGNFRDHEKRCPKKLIPCLAVDIHCGWNGLRDQLENHLLQCPFQAIRPLADHLKKELTASHRIEHELREKIKQQSNGIDYLRAVINRGNLMHRKCPKSIDECQVNGTTKTTKISFHCTLCNEDFFKERQHVVLHACSTKDRIDGICDECYRNQYVSSDESDDENDF